MNKPRNYNGCRNCIHQPRPMMMCEKGKALKTVHLVCPMWEERNVLDFDPTRHQFEAAMQEMLDSLSRTMLDELEKEKKVEKVIARVFVVNPSRKGECKMIHALWPDIHFLYDRVVEENVMYEITDETLKEMMIKGQSEG